jgi:hypothetical protein
MEIVYQFKCNSRRPQRAGSRFLTEDRKYPVKVAQNKEAAAREPRPFGALMQISRGAAIDPEASFDLLISGLSVLRKTGKRPRTLKISLLA